MRIILRRIIVLIIIAFTITGCAEQASFGSAITEGEPTYVPTPVVPNKPIYEVTRGDITYERRYFGRITPIVSRELSFPIEGRVIETFVSAGDTVTVGDVLARLDISNLEIQLIDAQEELAVAQSILDSATNQLNFASQQQQLLLNRIQIQLDHALTTADTPPTPDQQLAINLLTIDRDLAILEMNVLDSGVDPQLRFDVTRAQEHVEDIESIIKQAELVAEMDGVLTSFPIAVGDTILAFETVAVISDISEVEVTDDLDTDGMSDLAEGMPVIIQRAGLPGETYTGTIIAMPPPYGTGVDDLLHVAFDEQPTLDDDLSLGDRMTLDVVIDQRQNVLVLPASAIRQFSGRNFVVTQTDSIQQRVDVRVGLEGDGQVEILEGVEENQTVVGP